jgi:hypothetical protein
MTTFSTWTHPATGQVRVYVSNLAGQRGAKIWAEACAIDTFGSDYKLISTASNLNRSEQYNLVEDAERAMTVAASKRIKLFADVLALAA